MASSSVMSRVVCVVFMDFRIAILSSLFACSSWHGWSGFFMSAANWLASISLWFFTDKQSVSCRRWSIAVILVHPVAVLSASFCLVQFPPMGFGEVWSPDWSGIVEDGAGDRFVHN